VPMDDIASGAPAEALAGMSDRETMRNLMEFAEIHHFVKFTLDFRGLHEGDPDIANSITHFYDEELKLLSWILDQGIEQGSFRPVDPDRMARFISTYLDGCMARSVIVADFDLAGAMRDLHQCVLARARRSEVPLRLVHPVKSSSARPGLSKPRRRSS
jgi:hypothetical protein